MGNVRIDSSLEIDGRAAGAAARGLPRRDDRPDQPRRDPRARWATRRTRRSRPSSSRRRRRRATPRPTAVVFDALQMDVRLTVPNDLVVKAGSLQTPDAPISLGALNVTLGGDLARDRRSLASGCASSAPSTPCAAPTTSRAGGSRSCATAPSASTVLDELDPRARHPDAPHHSGGRGARQRPRHAEAAGDRPEQHAAARAGRHPVAHRVQPADQPARRRAADLARPARAGAGHRRRRRPARAVDRRRARTSTRSRSTSRRRAGGGAGADDRPAARAEPLREGASRAIGDQSQTNFILEYELTDWLRLQTNVLQGSTTQQSLFQRVQGSGVDLLFFFSY